MKNKNFNYRHLLFYALFAGLTASAAETNVKNISYGDEEYTVEERWTNKTAMTNFAMQSGDSFWGSSNFFFVKDGMIYITKDNIDTDCGRLIVVDGNTGTFLKTVTIDWNSYTPNESAATVFAGVDSEGTCYLASYATSTYNGYPFVIYPLEISEAGIPVVQNQYNLTLGTKWWVQAPDVYGSLTSGNFTVAAPIWNLMDATDDKKLETCLAVWTVTDGKETSRKSYDAKLTQCDVKILDDNLIALHDRHLVSTSTASSVNAQHMNNAIAPHPTIYTLDDNNLSMLSAVEAAAEDDPYGNGMYFFNFDGGNYLMAYASSGFTPEFKLMAVPDYPQSFNGAEVLCTLADKTAKLSTDKPDGSFMRTKVVVEKTSDNSADIYMAAHGKGMACYTIKREGSISTGIESIVDHDNVPAEYYSITGVKLQSPPAHGFYIIRQGNKAIKAFAQP